MANTKTKIMIIALCCLSLAAVAQTEEAKDKEFKKLIVIAKGEKNDAAYVKGMERADSFAKNAGLITGRAEVNATLGAYFYETNIDKSISYLLRAYDFYLETGDKRHATYAIENVAFAYQEYKKDIPTALKYTRKAIAERTEQKDTLSMANMYKYAAILYGKLGNYKEGKVCADSAVQLFAIKKSQHGLAVSYRDLADVYSSEGRSDSAIFYFIKAKDLWQAANGEKSRIYGWNNDMMDIYVKDNELKKAKELFQQNDTVTAPIYYTDKLHFYKSSASLFKHSKEKGMNKVYQQKYKNLSDSMRKEGKVIVD